MKLKLYFLIILLIGWHGSKNLRAETNDVDLFYNQTWAIAWDSTGTPYYDSKGSICFSNDGVILARMEIFNHWFMPHPFENKYHDLMLAKEVEIIDLKFDLDKSKKRNIKIFFIGAGIGTGLVIIPLILIKIIR